MITSANQSPAGPDEDSARPGGSISAMQRMLDRPLDNVSIREHTARVAMPLVAEERNTMSLVIVALGDELLALQSIDVARVQRLVTVHRIPHRSNEIIRGMCNIEGALVLTAALDRLLQIPVDSPSGEDERVGAGRMVVIGAPGQRWAFGVESVLCVERIEVSTFRKLPVTVERALVHYAEALVPVSDRHATLLDTGRLIDGLQGALV